MLTKNVWLDQARVALNLPSLRMRDAQWQEPTIEVVETEWVLGRTRYRKREIASPIFEWEIDGKRFAGAPELVVRKEHWHSWFVGGTRHHVDWLASFESLRKMVAESRESVN